MSNQNNNIIEELDFDRLSKYKFRIPLYQRKYAWSTDEVNALLDDLLSFYKRKKENDKYFIGNIVVEHKEDGLCDIIDGQQRLTTIYLLAKIAKSKDIFELHYEIRHEDDEFLKDFENEDKKLKADSQFRENIEAILKFQQIQLCDSKPTLNELLNLCKIALTTLPQGIDIVKYFEVMNNRGKQLEKHQILKAKLLEAIKSSEVDCQNDTTNYSKIWDYCSNMNVYIEDSIYYGDLKEKEKDIDKNARNPLFDFLGEKQPLPEVFKTNSDKSNNISIADIINPKPNPIKTTEQKEEFYIRQEYGSIVKFPVFLIQVLKIFLTNKIENNKINSVEVNDIVVNDRYLLDYFYKINDNKIKTNDFLFDCNQSKEFIKFLLKMRILYDYFIFKRDNEGEPFLDKIEIENGQYKLSETQERKDILMLQLLFNFSAPQYFAQDWLGVVLKWLNTNFKTEDNSFYSNYLKFLEDFDKKMAIARIENESLIDTINYYLTNSQFGESKCNLDNINFDFLNQGTSTPHYWFYKLDYLLWKECNNDKSEIWKLDDKSNFIESDRFKYLTIKSNFRLSRLNSIEHIHPQSKCNEWEEHNVDNCTNVDCFGNLVLISNHMNSTLNAQELKNKRQDIQKQLNNGTIESLKMILAYSKYKEWTLKNCLDHQENMIELLQKDLKIAPKGPKNELQ